MKVFLAILALSTLVVLAHSQGSTGAPVDDDLSLNDKETPKILAKIVQYVNNKTLSLSTVLSSNYEILKKTTQVVNGLKTTYTFKVPTLNNHTSLFYGEIWHAPWMGATHKVVKACTLDLSTISQTCSNGIDCRELVTQSGVCY